MLRPPREVQLHLCKLLPKDQLCNWLSHYAVQEQVTKFIRNTKASILYTSFPDLPPQNTIHFVSYINQTFSLYKVLPDDYVAKGDYPTLQALCIYLKKDKDDFITLPVQTSAHRPLIVYTSLELLWSAYIYCSKISNDKTVLCIDGREGCVNEDATLICLGAILLNSNRKKIGLLCRTIAPFCFLLGAGPEKAIYAQVSVITLKDGLNTLFGRF
jgi:hypothetical protein